MAGVNGAIPWEERAAGCLLGGAVGDALGAPVEFLGLDEIQARFGAEGVTGLASAYGRRGAVTDDTQMTLFTAEGLIRADNVRRTGGADDPVPVLHRAYVRWLATQGGRTPDSRASDRPDGWLASLRELKARRSPGTTCLTALESGRWGSPEERINGSKGCGGVMRVAPIGLASWPPFETGARAAALTHGHPTGFLAGGVLATMVATLAGGAAPRQAVDAVRDELPAHEGHEECLEALGAALAAAEDGSPSPERVEALGAGWIAEQALAVATYCLLVAERFEDGVLLAVNHGGDSDSTGSIAGSLLGTAFGARAIPDRWLAELELRREIERVAADLGAHFGPDAADDPDDLDRYPAS
jgi:ADP-ribosyl-[dinitrogen reductase] hydrolase